MSGLVHSMAAMRWRTANGLRRMRRILSGTRRALLPLPDLRLKRFVFAPPDMRTADPTIAADIYAGRFVFAGRPAASHGRSPFDIEPPTPAWAEVFYGFGWLRHLHAANAPLVRDNVRLLIADFAARYRRLPASARKPAVVARRLTAFLSHSPLVLEGSEHAAYHRYLALVRQDARVLRRVRLVSDNPLDRLKAAVALAAMCLCVEGAEHLERRLSRDLSDELDEQILADGGHVSRNPQVLFDLLLDLLPLRSTYAAQGLEAPRGLVAAIDRMIPHLKMLRHPDGSIALFNGMGVSEVDGLATIFASHDSGGRAAADAPYTGYQRLEAGEAVLIVETGLPPPFNASGEALAGCLSFEFSYGRQRIFINCGLPHYVAGALHLALRATAAHTAAMLADTSSCRFITVGDETRILSGPRAVTVTRELTDDGQSIRLSHDGYRAGFRTDLQRTLGVGRDGTLLTGSDVLVSGSAVQPATTALQARFHVHPSITATILGDDAVLLMPQRGPAWRFTVEGGSLALEDSMFFAGNDGPRRISQIIGTAASLTDPMTWRLEMQAAAPSA